jgi:serine/threonine protein kinase
MTTQHTPADDEAQLVEARARIGAVLQDKWRLETLLGVGGMAAVYSARHRNGKRVAVKMLHTEFSHHEQMRTRFLQEGYAANAIHHEGAVSVLDDDLAPDGSAFLVMELLEGETVEQRWEKQDRKLELDEVLAIGDQLLDVLAAAHAKNVIHRDVKPENLFITKTGVLKVLDFGIAKVFEQEKTRPTATQAGMIMGTPAFMAPEQARGRWEEVDGRTDLWAVGATMFTLLSGRYVHEAPSSHEQLILNATAPAPAIATVAPAVPSEVAAIVDRALAFERARRWPDARSMQQPIRSTLAALGVRSAPSSQGRTVVEALSLRNASQLTASPTAVVTTAPTISVLTQQREVRFAEAARLRASIGDLQQAYAATKRATVDAQTKVEAGRAERQSLEQWFHRRVGKRTAAVEEARQQVRGSLVRIARRALTDRAFGADFDPMRDRIVTLERAAKSATRDVTLHETALVAHDAQALHAGLIVLAVGALLALALLVAPIVWRATRVVEPQLPRSAEPHR